MTNNINKFIVYSSYWTIIQDLLNIFFLLTVLSRKEKGEKIKIQITFSRNWKHTKGAVLKCFLSDMYF